MAGESSFAGGGGGAAVDSFAPVSPSGPRGSDSTSKFSSLETMTDCVRRDPAGRRREEIGEERVAGRGVDVEVEIFGCDVVDVGIDDSDAEPKGRGEVASKGQFVPFEENIEDIPGAVMLGVDIGGVFRTEARSANGLSSSMKGDPPKREADPYPVDGEEKSPRGGDDIVQWNTMTGKTKG